MPKANEQGLETDRPAPVPQRATYLPPPPPSLNGGLYTGEPFLPGAPWRNFPAVPDSSYLVHVNLRSAHPPPGAQFQYPAAGHRPGNNYSPMPGVRPMEAPLRDVLCVPNPCAPVPAPAPQPVFTVPNARASM